MIKKIFAASVFAFLLLMASTAQADGPEFWMMFTFNPPLTVSDHNARIQLQVCTDEYCGDVTDTLALSCTKNVADTYSQCQGNSALRNYSKALADKATLRLATADDTLSTPFEFPGASATASGTHYNYIVKTDVQPAEVEQQ
jgi:hypothetical protein